MAQATASSLESPKLESRSAPMVKLRHTCFLCLTKKKTPTQPVYKKRNFAFVLHLNSFTNCNCAPVQRAPLAGDEKPFTPKAGLESPSAAEL